jgi:hypothetical protein
MLRKWKALAVLRCVVCVPDRVVRVAVEVEGRVDGLGIWGDGGMRTEREAERARMGRRKERRICVRRILRVSVGLAFRGG